MQTQRTDRVIRFTDFHPAHHFESFFFNVLLQHIPFRNESSLLSNNNVHKSYYIECCIRKLINTEDDIDTLVHEYCKLHFMMDENRQQLTNMIMQKAPIHGLDTPDPLHEDITNTDPHIHYTEKVFNLLNELQEVKDASLNDEQQSIFNKLYETETGLHIITGTPGSGKTFLIKYIMYKEISAGNTVVVTSTTGTSAARISSIAKTAHQQFALPRSRDLFRSPLQQTDARSLEIRHASVIIIDEFSMLTNLAFHQIMLQISNACNITLQSIRSQKKVIFFGDPGQLPAICEHTKRKNTEICESCHLLSSPFWTSGTFHKMTISMRHVSDPEFCLFLNYIRENQPSQEYIDNTLANTYISVPNLSNIINESITVLCTHREDANNYNYAILKNQFNDSDITEVGIESSAANEDELHYWVHDPEFTTIHNIAIGALIMITENIDLSIGACNGALATVISFEKNPSTQKLTKINVHITISNRTICIRRSKYSRISHASKDYYRSTFPIQLAYAITGHKCQGATIKGKVLLVIRHAFAPGQIYVMLSRVTTRKNLLILNGLRKSNFIPIPKRFLY